ncbi:alanyl-tRNA editing protein [Bacillus sp. EB106-08-02-XG196]|uniref:alanyl-tRNA editing protein n=1 Tax=Bacillus sp. EB106-08-02-XG196 TaxID=2737049 RepID=UPI0015C4AF88|nr:DHHA1 domain-containing protein [Bacillus sp. EB106-08-02-XG196]NWQ39271.1 alanyl-tRNA editing protein [Bacillus sp. EB106-08-02-XG196]
MKNQLFYQDAYIKSFTAKVVTKGKDEDGKDYIVLDQTAFYPTGGGQPHDIGTIENIKVLNVEETDEEVRHYLESEVHDVSSPVYGVIDWDRRYDHMQQHAGQHILSAAFEQLYGHKTIGFHLGNETLTIDLEAANLLESEALKVEELANKIILENRPIETKWVTEDELVNYDLRKETKVKEDIRLVIIPNFDYNGCGGTHPNATGEVQAIKIIDWERQKKKVRVQFVCGNRVLKQFHQKNRVLIELTKLLNAPEKDMQEAVTRLLENSKSMEKELEQSLETLLHNEAKGLLEKGKGDNKIVSGVFQNRSIQELQKLARMIIAEDEETIVLFVSQNENRLQLVGARGTAENASMKKVIGNALSIINGKGGGSDSFAQGGGEAIITGEKMMLHLLELIQ